MEAASLSDAEIDKILGEGLTGAPPVDAEQKQSGTITAADYAVL